MNTILISGAAGGLGTAVVRRFLRADWHVLALTDPNTPDQADQLKALEGASDRLEAAPLDLRDAAAAGRFFEVRPAPVHAAALLVGGFAMGGVADTPSEDIDEMISLNFKTAYHVARPCFARMRKQGGGRLVFVGARPAFDPAAGSDLVAYALSKGLVKHLSELLNAAGQEDDVVSSLIVPSIIDTPANRESMPDADFDTWPKPAELAEVIFTAAQPGILREPVYKVYGKA